LADRNVQGAGRQIRQQGIREVSLRWSISPHARRLLVLALTGVVLAIVTRRPEFAGVAAPPLLILATWPADRRQKVRLTADLPTAPLVEGIETSVRVTFADNADFDVTLEIEPGDGVLTGPVETLTAVPGQPYRPVGLRLMPTRWGRYSPGMLLITFTDRYALTEGIAWLQLDYVAVRPNPAGLDSAVVLSRLPSRLGEHPARAAGEGAEFYGVREFVPGDRQRRINWPATTRLGRLHLSTFAVERTQHVVVIADETTDVGEPGSSSLDLVLRGASGTISRYLSGRDRVGLIIFAGRLAWIGPGQGERHFHRLLDLMMSTPGGWERASGLTKLPRAALPPGALILVFSPLLDPRLIEALRDLRERGFNVIAIDVLNSEPSHDGSRLSRLTTRMWHLEQQAVRFSLTQIGIPVVHWNGESSLDEPLAPYTRRTLVARR
jgi:uncharacterized protein (DUF58 family)